MVRLNILAADIHKRMVEDDRFGYSWSERYGASTEKWTVDGVDVTIGVGDYDCSSSAITAWRLALKAAEVTLGNATFTGDMLPVFLATGLFEWRTDFSRACRGDLYLNEANHVAMCQGGGKLSEFSMNEYGGAYGGKRGDQTGYEGHMGNYYNYPWNGYLHYIGTLEVGKKDAKEEVKDMALTANELEKIALKVWGYRNSKLEKSDAYSILRTIRNDVADIKKRVAALEKKMK